MRRKRLKKILVVDDDPADRTLLRKILGKSYIVIEADGGEEAIDLACREEPDLVLLIFGALFFKLNIETSGAIGSVVDFLISIHVPPNVLLFLLPMLVSFSTGVTTPTVAITYPFLIAFMGTGADTKMGLETLAFSGLLFGLWITPVHLCLPLSASYFQTSLLKIIIKMVLPAIGVAMTGALMAFFFG